MFVRIKRILGKILEYRINKGYGHRTNRFSPLIWLDGVLLPVLGLIAWRIDDPIYRAIVIGLIILIVLLSIGIYIYLLFCKPEYLVSERFKTDEKMIQVIAQQQGGEPEIIDESDMTVVKFQKRLNP